MGTSPARHNKSRTRDRGGRRAVMKLRHNHNTPQGLDPEFHQTRVVILSNGRIAVASSATMEQADSRALTGVNMLMHGLPRQHPRLLLTPPHIRLHQTSGSGVTIFTHDAHLGGSGVAVRGGGLYPRLTAFALASLFTFQLQATSTA
jgi:hypothetical protein